MIAIEVNNSTERFPINDGLIREIMLSNSITGDSTISLVTINDVEYPIYPLYQQPLNLDLDAPRPLPRQKLCSVCFLPSTSDICCSNSVANVDEAEETPSDPLEALLPPSSSFAPSFKQLDFITKYKDNLKQLHAFIVSSVDSTKQQHPLIPSSHRLIRTLKYEQSRLHDNSKLWTQVNGFNF